MAVNVNGEFVKPVDVAVSVFEPAVVPKVQLFTVAIPLLFVVAGEGELVSDPPPDAAANVTLFPLTGFPLVSFTITLGNIVTAEPALVDWLFPALMAIDVADPAVMVKLLETALVKLLAAAVKV